jgi:RNase P/RNase MRP subunit p29
MSVGGTHLSLCLVRPRARVAAYATLTVLVGVSVLWLSGGLRAADTPRSVPAGRQVDQHLFRTRLVGAHVAVIKKTKFTSERRLLVINAWVTNPTRETLGTSGADSDHAVFSHGMFLHWNTRNGPRPNLVDAQAIAGNTLFRSLQPQLPTYVAVQYELTPRTVVPDHVTVALASYEHTEAGILDPRGYWEWQARRYEKKVETNALTHKSGLVTVIIPVLAANVTLPVKR